MRFPDRIHAGWQLAERLAFLQPARPVVVGIPPGGVPVAFEVARAIDAPLDIVGVSALSAPLRPDIVVGAVGEHGARILNKRLVRHLNIVQSWLDTESRRVAAVLADRVRWMRGGRPACSVRGRTVIVVDEAMVNESTARAAIEVMRRRGARRVILATPIIAMTALRRIQREVDQVISIQEVSPPYTVTRWYDEARPVSKDKIRRLLAVAAGVQPDIDCDVVIPVHDGRLIGRLTIPMDATGLVLFMHGVGRSRCDPQGQELARHLNHARLGTLLLDLISEREFLELGLNAEVDPLADRLVTATSWIVNRPELGLLPLGYFSTGTAAAAALAAAAKGQTVDTIVCCAGRTDRAAEWLPRITAPTLLIAGRWDVPLLKANRQALRTLRCPAKLELVPGTANPFEEPAALYQVVKLTIPWFRHHLHPLAAAQ